MDYKLGNIFSDGQRAKNAAAVEAMNEEIRKVGDLLHFTVTISDDGWTAECDEIEGIVTGGKSQSPSDDEIKANIQEAIHTAFNVETVQEEKKILNRNEIGAVFSVAAGAGQRATA